MLVNVVESLPEGLNTLELLVGKELNEQGKNHTHSLRSVTVDTIDMSHSYAGFSHASSSRTLTDFFTGCSQLMPELGHGLIWRSVTQPYLERSQTNSQVNHKGK